MVTVMNPLGSAQEFAHNTNETVAQFKQRTHIPDTVSLVYNNAVLKESDAVPEGSLRMVPRVKTGLLDSNGGVMSRITRAKLEAATPLHSAAFEVESEDSIASLKRQLAEKDREIKRKDKEIERKDKEIERKDEAHAKEIERKDKVHAKENELLQKKIEGLDEENKHLRSSR